MKLEKYVMIVIMQFGQGYLILLAIKVAQVYCLVLDAVNCNVFTMYIIRKACDMCKAITLW